MLLTLVSFLFAIALLVTVHEYGHYRVAKQLGVKVLKFSIGFGKPLLIWQRGETQWQIAAIPLGGFVSMLGENEDQTLSLDEVHRAFNRQHPLRKMAIVVAGPLANLLLAWWLFALALMVGMDTLKPVVSSVRVGSVAEQAGLHSGDEVLRFGTHAILDWEDLRIAALAQTGNGETIALRVRSDKGERDLLLDTKKLGSHTIDAQILARLGFSALPLLNRIAEVEKNSVAARAGLQVGDEIVSIDGQVIAQWEKLQAVVAMNPGRELALKVLRAGNELDMKVTPQAADRGQPGRIGVAPQVDDATYAQHKFRLQLNPVAALGKGAQKAWNLSVMTLQMMGRMFTGGLSASNVSGPIGIASMAGASASLGLAVYLQYLALVSLSLGVLNLLPVPVLDGGHLLYHSAELVRGRPLPASWQAMGQRVGIVLLVGLMLLAFYNDINRFITG